MKGDVQYSFINEINVAPVILSNNLYSLIKGHSIQNQIFCCELTVYLNCKTEKAYCKNCYNKFAIPNSYTFVYRHGVVIRTEILQPRCDNCHKDLKIVSPFFKCTECIFKLEREITEKPIYIFRQ